MNQLQRSLAASLICIYYGWPDAHSLHKKVRVPSVRNVRCLNHHGLEQGIQSVASGIQLPVRERK